MPVNTPHADFSYWSPEWQKIRVFAAGAKAVKDAGQAYLPKLTSQTDAEFAAYKLRAEVYGAIDRTVDGLEGAIFRKEPRFDGFTAADQPIMDDVTQTGTDLKTIAREITREILTTGRMGVLVDFAAPAEGQPAGRAYLVPYAAERIINWQTITVGGKEMLSLVVLEEADPKASEDGFTQVARKRYRVLRLIEGVYHAQIWTLKKEGAASVTVPLSADVIRPAAGTAAAGDEYAMTADVIPQRIGSPLKQIPFYFFSPSGAHSSPQKPPLLDIADLCHQHYMASADYAHGLHYVALPVLYAFGIEKTSQITLGPAAALVSENENAKAGMIEFTGQGLGAFEKRLESLEKKMAVLGAKLLEESKKAAETAEAVKMRASGDESVLSGIAQAVGEQLAHATDFVLWWSGTGEMPDVQIELNRDYVSGSMEPALLTALLQARQAGEITRETFLWNMQRGEVLPPDVTITDEIDKLDQQAPAMAADASGAGIIGQ